MKKITIPVLALAAMLSLSGCFFDYPEPAVPDSGVTDASLIGTWNSELVKDDHFDNSYYSISLTFSVPADPSANYISFYMSVDFYRDAAKAQHVFRQEYSGDCYLLDEIQGYTMYARKMTEVFRETWFTPYDSSFITSMNTYYRHWTADARISLLPSYSLVTEMKKNFGTSFWFSLSGNSLNNLLAIRNGDLYLGKSTQYDAVDNDYFPVAVENRWHLTKEAQVHP